jgi:hypothetical protein
MFGGGGGSLVSPKRSRRQLCQHFSGFLHLIKVRQQEKNSIPAVCQRMRRLKGFLCKAANNFEIFLKILNQILKKEKI